MLYLDLSERYYPSDHFKPFFDNVCTVHSRFLCIDQLHLLKCTVKNTAIDYNIQVQKLNIPIIFCMEEWIYNF